MAVFHKFNQFVEDMASKKHDLKNDQLKIALTDSAPAATDAVLSDITEISYDHVSSRLVTTTSCEQTNGVLKLVCEDLTITATGGAIPQFRYVVLYNDTAANDPVICWYDYGEEINLKDGESLKIDFNQTEGVLTIQ